MTTLNEKQAKLFTDRNWGVIATIRPGEKRVIIQIHPERVDGFGAGG